MQRLWQAAVAEATPPRVGIATLREQLGGTERIVYRHLEDALAALADARRDLAVDVLRPLVSPAGTKIAWRAADLAYFAKRPVADIEPILRELSSGEQRILRSVMPPPSHADSSPRYEIFHDILAEPILEWCAEREAERERARLQREAEARERERKSADERRRRERRNRVVRVVAIVLGALVVGLVVAILAAFDKNEIADSRALASGATSQLAVDPERGLLLALEAMRRRDTAEAKQALRRAFVASRVRAVLGSGRPRPCGACAGLATTARASGAAIERAAVAPDGSAVAGIVGISLRLWQPRSGATSQPRPRIAEVRGVAFTPDAARLLVVGVHTTAVMAPDGSRAVVLRDAGATGNGGATSPDGRRVVTTGERGMAVWDARSGVRLARRADRTGFADVAFESPGRVRLQDQAGYVLKWSWRSDRLETLADVQPGQESLRFAAGAGFSVDGVANGRVRVVGPGGANLGLPSREIDRPVADVAISSSGSRVAIARDSLVELWGSGRGRRWSRATRVATLVHTDRVNDVVFSADGALVATASTDGTARVWESATGDLVADLRGHGAAVEAIAFSSRGRYVTTVGADLTIRLWDLGAERTLRGSHSVVGVAVAPSGSRVAVAEEDGPLSIRDVLAGPAPPPPAPGPSSPGRAPPPGAPAPAAAGPQPPLIQTPTGLHPTSVAFATRTPLVLAGFAASGGSGGRARLLDANGRVRAEIAAGRAVREVALDARARVGAVVLDVGDGRTRVELWSLAGRRPAKALWRVPLSAVEAASDVALSGDGRRLLVTSVYGLARVFDVAARRPLHTLAGGTFLHAGQEEFYRGVFSPDGETVAVAGSRDVRLWDVASGKERGFRLSGHTSVLRSIAYDAGGTRLVTASADGTVRVWDARRGTALAVIARHSGRVNGAVFLRNGWIASGGDDRTIRAYPCESCGSAGSLVKLAERHVTRELSDRERAELGGG